MSSIFTRIINREIPCHKIWEDDHFFAFLDINPIQPGMTLVVPKMEIDNAFDMPDEVFCEFMKAAKRLHDPIRTVTGAKRVALVIEGLEVPHAHIKLIPISESGDMNQENAKAMSSEELEGIAAKIRAQLK